MSIDYFGAVILPSVEAFIWHLPIFGGWCTQPPDESHVEQTNIFSQLTCRHVENGSYRDTVVILIDAEDSDVAVLAAKVAHEISGDLGIKHKKKIVDLKKFC